MLLSISVIFILDMTGVRRGKIKRRRRQRDALYYRPTSLCASLEQPQAAGPVLRKRSMDPVPKTCPAADNDENCSVSSSSNSSISLSGDESITKPQIYGKVNYLQNCHNSLENYLCRGYKGEKRGSRYKFRCNIFTDYPKVCNKVRNHKIDVASHTKIGSEAVQQS